MIKNSISVVIPVYNEEKNIKKTIDELVEVLKKNFTDYEIIIVESNSTDCSRSIIQKFAKKNSKIKPIFQDRKKGYSNALRLGLKKCRKKISMYVDCDLPYDFMYLVKGAKYIGKYDAVLGYKLEKRESLGRATLSRGARMIGRLFFGIKIRDGFSNQRICVNLIIST